jgi:hypothetical protein
MASVSCNLLTPIIFVGEHRKQISPEFDKLANARVAVVVWTEPATLFDFPHARFELATYVADKLSYEMAQRNLGTQVVDSRDVEDYLQRDLDAQIDPQAVGRHFRADYVIYLEVLTFQIRNPDEPQFLRGRVDASVAVHDLGADADETRRYELAPVHCIYPDGAPILMNATNSALVREQTYRKFAEEVARKFYEHTVEL